MEQELDSVQEYNSGSYSDNDAEDNRTFILDSDEFDHELEQNRNCLELDIGFKPRRIRYGLLDDFDIAIRYVLCMASILSIILFTSEDALKEYLPGNFLIGITASLIFITPFVGSAMTNCLSWIFGAFTGCFIAWLTTLILGTSTETILVQSSELCSIEIITQEGAIGNPNEIVLGIIIFLVNFSLNYFSVSPIWAKAGGICFNVFTLLWFVSMKNPLAVKLNGYDFYQITQTTIIGVLFGLLFLMIPLPRWNGSVYGFPYPRLTYPVVKKKLSEASKELEELYVFFNKEYQDNHFQRLQEESHAQYQVKLLIAQELIKEAKKLLHSSVKWEPLFTCSSLSYSMLLEYADNLHLLSVQLTSILILFKDRIKKKPPKQYENTEWEEICNAELHDHLNHLQDGVIKILSSIRKGKNIEEKNSHVVEVQLELLRLTVADIYKDIEISDRLSTIGREHSYHCNCLWKFHNISKTILTFNDIFLHPKGKHFFRRWLDWPIEYVQIWRDSFHEFFVSLLWKRDISFKTFIVHRHRIFAGSFQIGLAAIVGSLFVLISHLRENIPSGFAIVLSAILIMDRDNPGSQFAKGEARLSGTALAVGGSFIITAFFRDDQYSIGYKLGIFFFVCFYSFLARFIQCNPKYSYLSFSFMVTLFSILFEVSPNAVYSNVINSTNGRATATTLGVVIASFCNVLWPIRSRMILKHQIAKNIYSYISILDHIFDIYNDDWESDVSKVHEVLNTCSNNINQQILLIENASLEPSLWRDHFTVNPYLQIAENQHLLLLSLLGSWKMNSTLRMRIFKTGSNNFYNLFSDKDTWFYAHRILSNRIQHSVYALETSSYVRLIPNPLVDCYFEWVSFVKHKLSTEKLNSEVYISLWAMLMNYSFVVEDIVALCNSLDQLQENIRLTRESGISLGNCLYVRPVSRTLRR